MPARARETRAAAPAAATEAARGAARGAAEARVDLAIHPPAAIPVSRAVAPEISETAAPAPAISEAAAPAAVVAPVVVARAAEARTFNFDPANYAGRRRRRFRPACVVYIARDRD